jgi:anti-sigma B factor antagonist
MSIITNKVKDKNVVIINAPERLDVLSAEEFRNVLNDTIEKNDFKIVVNLENTKYIDSTGLGALVSKIALTRSNKGDIRLATPKPSIIDLLELTHLIKILKCFDTVDAAINSYIEPKNS